MYTALIIISYILSFLVFLPLVKNSYWIFRALEYPRFQKFVLCCLVLAGWGIYYYLYKQVNIHTVILLVIAIVYLAVKIYNYTIFAFKEVRTITTRNPPIEIKVLSANVYKENREYHRLLKQIEMVDPDIIFLLETDKGWEEAVNQLETTHPYNLKAPLANTYGLLFYSRFEISNAQVNYLVKHDVPSIEAVVHLPSGIKVQVWGLHPEPPVPGESLDSAAKDKELMQIAFKARDCSLPVIVMGDLNDVAWSDTTILFEKVSELLDIRKGRGFYSTFSAKSRLLRFPLDYIFCSADFGLIEMKKLGYNGSDHFPIFTHLIYNKNLEKIQDCPHADKDDMEDAEEILNKQVKED